jgi:hypothetical protein
MKQETIAKTHNRALPELYISYPYKKPHEGTMTRPPLYGQEFVTNHKLSMTWRQWHEFIKIYLKYVKLYMLSGHQVVLPHHAGVMQLHKKKDSGKNVDWNRFNTTGEYAYHKNNHTNGYVPTFKWYRNRYEARLKNKFHWAAVLNRGFKSQISKAIKSDPQLLMSYSTPSYTRKASDAIKPI